MALSEIPGPPLLRLRAPQFYAGLSFLEECQRRYGDVFRAHFPFLGSVVVLADPAAIRAVYGGKDTMVTAARARLLQDLFIGDPLGLLDGQRHLRRRRLMLRAFTAHHLAMYEDVIADVVDCRISGWRPGDTVEMHSFGSEVSNEVMSRILYGPLDPAARTGLQRLVARTARAWAPTTILPDRARSERLPGPWRRFARLQRELKQAVDAQVREHRRRADEEPPSDVCSLLVTATDENGAALSDEEVRTELLGLDAGGSVTASAIGWMFERVLHDPRTLARLEQTPSDSGFCQAVVEEALRLNPPVGGAPRELAYDLELGGFQVPAGTIVIPSFYLVHRRSDLYDRPTEFRPDRFLGTRPATYEWLPFGGGPHRCLGAGLAPLQMRVMLRQVFQRWQLRSTRPGIAGARRSRAFVWVPRGGVPATVVGPAPGASSGRLASEEEVRRGEDPQLTAPCQRVP